MSWWKRNDKFELVIGWIIGLVGLALALLMVYVIVAAIFFPDQLDSVNETDSHQVQQLVLDVDQAEQSLFTQNGRYSDRFIDLLQVNPELDSQLVINDNAISLKLETGVIEDSYRISAAHTEEDQLTMFTLSKLADGSVLRSCIGDDACQDGQWVTVNDQQK